jgi:hypothetical protein
MSRRRTRRDKAAELVVVSIIMAALFVGPTIAAFFRDRPWALPLALCTVVLGLTGLTAFALTLRRMRRAERDRRRLLVKNWARFSDKEFEHYVAGLFRQDGWQAQVVGGTADGGMDIKLRQNGKTGIAQVKQYLSGRPVSVKEVREFSAVINRTGVDQGYFVTAGPFTQPAIDWAKAEPMTLIDGDELARWADDARQAATAEPARSGFSPLQWLTLALLATTACSVFGFAGTLLLWG